MIELGIKERYKLIRNDRIRDTRQIPIKYLDTLRRKGKSWSNFSHTLSPTIFLVKISFKGFHAKSEFLAAVTG